MNKKNMLALILCVIGFAVGYSSNENTLEVKEVLLACEDDECEPTGCIDNPLGFTSCDALDGGTCKTLGCEFPNER